MTKYKVYNTVKEACAAKAKELLENGEVEGMERCGPSGPELYISSDEKLAYRNSVPYNLVSVEGVFFYIGFPRDDAMEHPFRLSNDEK